jgi:hypothetical protein
VLLSPSVKMSEEINFDQFQREINEAERYLSKQPTTGSGGLNDSMTFHPVGSKEPSVRNPHLDTSHDDSSNESKFRVESL